MDQNKNLIIIVDYGMGNIRSVQKAFERIKVPVKVTANADDILNAEQLILPGVGHFEKGIKNIKERGLFNCLNEAVLDKKIPILGICLGMQLMTEFSEEGNLEGFGWIKGKTKKFSFESKELKIPHMGWNNLSIKNTNSLFNGIKNENLFYFVHSYFVTCENEENILSETNYGIKFVSSFQRGNIYGCQFHPEKSHDAGLQVLKNFAEL